MNSRARGRGARSAGREPVGPLDHLLHPSAARVPGGGPQPDVPVAGRPARASTRKTPRPGGRAPSSRRPTTHPRRGSRRARTRSRCGVHDAASAARPGPGTGASRSDVATHLVGEPEPQAVVELEQRLELAPLDDAGDGARRNPPVTPEPGSSDANVQVDLTIRASTLSSGLPGFDQTASSRYVPGSGGSGTA